MLCKPAICTGVRLPSVSRLVLRDRDLLRERRDLFLLRSRLFERECFLDRLDRSRDRRFREREFDRECDFRRDDIERNFVLKICSVWSRAGGAGVRRVNFYVVDSSKTCDNR